MPSYCLVLVLLLLLLTFVVVLFIVIVDQATFYLLLFVTLIVVEHYICSASFSVDYLVVITLLPLLTFGVLVILPVRTLDCYLRRLPTNLFVGVVVVVDVTRCCCYSPRYNYLHDGDIVRVDHIVVAIPVLLFVVIITVPLRCYVPLFVVCSVVCYIDMQHSRW